MTTTETRCPKCSGPLDPQTVALGIAEAACVWCWTEETYDAERPFTAEQVGTWLARETDSYSAVDAAYVLSHAPDGTELDQLPNREPEYERTCRIAATEQGLDPIIETLRAAGIPAVVEQTGGFCMVASIYGEGRYVGVVREGRRDDGEWGYMVCSNSADFAGGDEIVVVPDAPLADLPEIVRKTLGQ